MGSGASRIRLRTKCAVRHELVQRGQHQPALIGVPGADDLLRANQRSTRPSTPFTVGALSGSSILRASGTMRIFLRVPLPRIGARQSSVRQGALDITLQGPLGDHGTDFVGRVRQHRLLAAVGVLSSPYRLAGGVPGLCWPASWGHPTAGAAGDPEPTAATRDGGQSANWHGHAVDPRATRIPADGRRVDPRWRDHVARLGPPNHAAAGARRGARLGRVLRGADRARSGRSPHHRDLVQRPASPAVDADCRLHTDCAGPSAARVRPTRRVGIWLVLYGGGNGIYSIARGTVPLALFGPARYPLVVGRLARPGLVAQALAPPAGAFVLTHASPDALWWTLFALALANLGLIGALWRTL